MFKNRAAQLKKLELWPYRAKDRINEVRAADEKKPKLTFPFPYKTFKLALQDRMDQEQQSKAAAK